MPPGKCTTADESPEHLYCKPLIAKKAVLDVCGTVSIERPGMSPAREEWVSPRFLREGAAKLELKVQMSPWKQIDAEWTERTSSTENSYYLA